MEESTPRIRIYRKVMYTRKFFSFFLSSHSFVNVITEHSQLWSYYFVFYFSDPKKKQQQIFINDKNNWLNKRRIWKICLKLNFRSIGFHFIYRIIYPHQFYQRLVKSNWWLDDDFNHVSLRLSWLWLWFWLCTIWFGP